MTEDFQLLADGEVHTLPAWCSPDSVGIDPADLSKSLHWTLKAEGLCQGEVCVPVRDRDALLRDGRVDLAAFAAALGRPLALDGSARAAALGTAAGDRAAQLATLEAPDFALPDLSGQIHRLSDHRGRKVLLIAYASW